MKKLLVTAAIVLSASAPLLASEVYINQVGGALTVDILQENGLNRINTENDPALLEGDDINVQVTQTGDMNEMDLYLQQNANSTNFVYSATGDMNTIVANIYGGIDNSFVATLLGNSNVVTLCKDYTNSVCNGIIVNLTNTVMNITGNSNTVNLAYDSANATNNIDIGQTTPSDNNIVNLTQTTANGFNNVNMTIDGDSNTVDILQN
jgi:hypothetical protein